MSTLAEIEGQLAKGRSATRETAPPARTVRLSPAEFSPTWAKAPSSDVVVGIRVYSESDARSAEAEAAKQETKAAAETVLFSIAVARGICDPNDIAAPHPLFPMAEDTLPMALTPRAMRRLFDEIERLHVDQSPVYAEATDDELIELAAALMQPEPVGKLPSLEQKRVRRYLRLALDALTERSG